MNSKERVLTAINHEEPDKVPIDIWMVYEVQEILRKYLDVDISSDSFALAKALGNDVLFRYMGISECFNSIYKEERKIGENLYQDDWGIKWKKISQGRNIYSGFVEHPLSDMKNYYSYKWPQLLDADRKMLEMYKNFIKKDGKEYAIVGAVPCTVLEASWYLRGFENFLIDLHSNKDFAIELLEKTMEYHLNLAKKLVKAGVDIFFFGDDIASEDGPLINPKLYRELIKPKHAYLIHEVKKINKNIKIAYHTDGKVDWALDDIIEIGVDILNPLQPDVNDVEAIKKKYGKKLTFWGNVDTRNVLADGSSFDVVEEVKNVIRKLGSGGGLILCSNHRMQNTPRAIDNIIAFYWAANAFRAYPLKLDVIKEQKKANWYI